MRHQDPDAVLEAGDVLIGVGTTEEMAKLEVLFAPARGTGCLIRSHGSPAS